MSYAEAWREDRRRWRRLLLWVIGLPVGFTLLVFGFGGLVLLLYSLLERVHQELVHFEVHALWVAQGNGGVIWRGCPSELD
jgi:uncharacterized iron-regulated membrane protein